MKSDVEQQIRQSTGIFLMSRMNDRAAFEWAVALETRQSVQREVVEALLNHPTIHVSEPYRTAWNWLLESWQSNPALSPQSKHGLQMQTKRFGQNGRTLGGVVDQVKPRLDVETRPDWEWNLIYKGKPRPKPKRPQQLARFKIDSGELVNLEEIGVDAQTPTEYLIELFQRVEAGLIAGLHLGVRIGDIPSSLASLVNDINFVHLHVERDVHQQDPDRYKTGFAPSVRLLDGLLGEIKQRNSAFAKRVMTMWRDSEWGIFRRLWAAGAVDPELVTSRDVSDFLTSLTKEEFWLVHEWREMSYLRAVRFHDLSADAKKEILHRIRRGPPKSLFWRKLTTEEYLAAKRLSVAQELQRIQVSGNVLPNAEASWLNNAILQIENWVPLHTALSDVIGISHGVREYKIAAIEPRAGSVLADIEAALHRQGEQSGAAQYLREHLAEVLALLEGSHNPSSYPATLNILIYRLKLRPDRIVDEQRPLAKRLILLLLRVQDEALRHVVGGLAEWIEEWVGEFRDSSDFVRLWLRLWPVACDETNAKPDAEEGMPPRRLADEALNTSVGHLFSAMRKYFPNLINNPRPFAEEPLRSMRAASINSTGRAKRQVLHRYLQDIEYLRNADVEWVDRELLQPLLHSIGPDIEIWDAISRHAVLKYETMKIVGERMADLVGSSATLSNEIRARLAERLVFAVLADRLAERELSVQDMAVQQMLRRSTDAVRARAATACHYLLNSAEMGPTDAEERYVRCVKPFFEQVWPRELTLRSRVLSDRLASLPAETGRHFADAVKLLHRYLTPFDCWSLWEYRVLKRPPIGEEICLEATPQNAKALLQLLDATIGTEEGAVFPHDVDKALKWIREHSRQLVNDPRYARLVALARH